jgi:uncharacterized protein YndB with AHSA1/START domain
MVTDASTDTDTLTVSITTELDASPERVWELWQDPRLLEKWWGPPGYPATFGEHGLEPGDRVSYFMTSPEGQQYHGWWEIVSAERPRRIEFRDGFADENGQPNEEMPINVSVVTIDAGEDGSPTRMSIAGTYPSREDMDRVLEMGAVEGMTMAMNQIDDLL